jgi:hypothetical protein
MAKRRLNSGEGCGWYLPSSPNHLTFLLISLSLSLSLSLSFSAHCFLHVSGTIIFSASFPIILTIVLGMGLGITTPSDWT